MVQKKGRRKLYTALAVFLVLLVAIGTIALIKALGSDKQDPYLKDETSSSIVDTSDDADANQDATPDAQDDADATKTDETDKETAPDPATVATVDIAPMEITVSYVKGAGGFEYEVLRTSNGTRYVEFRSSDLAGTKCTNDKGTFATILANPNETEGATISKTTTVDGTKYGLSLEGATCTSSTDKLEDYQKSFSDAFSLLKKMK